MVTGSASGQSGRSDSLFRIRFGSIQFKYLAAVFTVMIVISIGAATYLASNQARILNQFVEVKGQELANYLARISANPLYDSDTLILDANVLGLCRNPDVLYAAVVDKKDAFVTSRFSSFNKDAPQVTAAKKRLGAEFENQELIDTLKRTATLSEHTSPVIVDEQTIGKVVVGISKDKVRQEVRAMVLSVIAVFALLCLAACSVLMIISRRIVLRPLETIARVSFLVAQGDFTQRVPPGSRDEIGALGESFNTLVENLGLTVERINGSFANLDEVAAKVGVLAGKISQGSDDQMLAVSSASADVGEILSSLGSVSESVGLLFSSAEKSAASTQEMSASIGQVASNSDDLSTSADSTASTIRQTAASVSQVAASVEKLFSLVSDVSASIIEISASVQEVERNAREASNLAEKVSDVVTGKGNPSVGRAVAGMNQIEEAITSASVVVRELGKHSQGIGQIVGVIKDIADQTSLLALNANILAAQAGEHGRGFHVVAGEIKSLAETTTENTKKISGIIAMIQKEAAKASDAMEVGLQRAGEGVSLIAEVEKTLLAVQETAELSSGATRQIAHATAEQLAGTRQIASSAEVMTQMSREITAATKEQAQGTAHITNVVERMREAASQVRGATSEQANGAKELATASEQTSRLAERITRSVQEQDVRSKRIGESMNRVQVVAQESTAVVLQLRGLVTSLGEQAALLKSDLERISVKRKVL